MSDDRSEIQQQRPDGSWRPADPLAYHAGYDAERYADGRWVLYKNIPHSVVGRAGASVQVATGRTLIGLLFAISWRRLLKPVRA